MTARGVLSEKLAAIEHERWADWQRYLHSRCEKNEDGSLTIPASFVAHWERQIATPYAELTEKEKESDREQVRRYWPLIEEIITRAEYAEAAWWRLANLIVHAAPGRFLRKCYEELEEGDLEGPDMRDTRAEQAIRGFISAMELTASNPDVENIVVAELRKIGFADRIRKAMERDG